MAWVGLTLTLNVNPTKVLEQIGHPVLIWQIKMTNGDAKQPYWQIKDSVPGAALVRRPFPTLALLPLRLGGLVLRGLAEVDRLDGLH